MMENHFKSFVEVQNFENHIKKKVFLARSLSPIPGYPAEFIVKQFATTLPPEEYFIHECLSSSFESILKLLYHWKEANMYYICIEYCPNGSLHNVLKTGIRFSFDHCLRYCYQLSLTVFNMHSKNICHRDIKPSNIFITENFNHFKLGDFGESKGVDIQDDYHTIVGTLYYMTPEQQIAFKLKQRSLINPFRNDIWALGLTFLEIFIGGLYFDRYHPKEMKVSDIHSFIDQNIAGQPAKEMKVSDIHSFIDQNIAGQPAKEKFANLLKRMICEKHFFDLDSFRVASEVYEIFLDNQKFEESLRGSELRNRENSIELNIKSSKDLKDCPDFSIENYDVNSIPNNLRIIHENSDENQERDPKSSEDQSKSDFSWTPSKILNDSKCALCDSIIEGNQLILPCRHLLHRSCCKSNFETILMTSKERIPYFCCKICSYEIPFTFFENMNFINPKARKNASLQQFSKTTMRCFNCVEGLEYNLLNRNLKPFKVKCKNCKLSFCSFCSVKGNHVFNCGLYSDYKKKGKIILKDYISAQSRK